MFSINNYNKIYAKTSGKLHSLITVFIFISEIGYKKDTPTFFLNTFKLNKDILHSWFILSTFTGLLV